ncbi:IclR family transcriptional regulator [Corynebacterium nasicanis]|uniref:IclR family transcriptional regulator n=1 Tax=Corynebacterium nasicanis TaxID=1448267 RepID=A0ABW1QB62_9CORY
MVVGQVPAARHTLRILTLLASLDVPVSAARIRSELDLPRSTTYHLLKVMQDAGYVVRIPDDNTYGLGLIAYSMASAYTQQQPLVRVGARLLEQAANLVSGSGHISRLSGSEVLYLHEIRAQGAVSLVTEIGVRLPAPRTASGRSMLAFLPEVEARAAFAAAPSQGVTLREFQGHLAEIRSRGWAEEIEEVSRGQQTVAVPVIDHLDRPAASLAVTFPVRRLEPPQITELLERLLAASAKLSASVYGRRP